MTNTAQTFSITDNSDLGPREMSVHWAGGADMKEVARLQEQARVFNEQHAAWRSQTYDTQTRVRVASDWIRRFYVSFQNAAEAIDEGWKLIEISAISSTI